MDKNNEVDRFSDIFTEDQEIESSLDNQNHPMNEMDNVANITIDNVDKVKSEESEGSLFTTPEVNIAPGDSRPTLDYKLVTAYLIKDIRSKVVNPFFEKVKGKMKPLTDSYLKRVEEENVTLSAGEEKPLAPVEENKEDKPLVKILVRASVASVFVALLTTGQNLGSVLPNKSIESVKAQFLTTNDPVEILTQELESANLYATNHKGSFYGYKINKPVIGITGNRELILTLTQEGRCWSTGVADGYPSKEIRFDPSGARCQESNLIKISAVIR